MKPVTFFFDTNDTSRPPVNTDAPVFAVRVGEVGFYPINTTRLASELNVCNDPEVLESAFAASMFGWDVPIADTAKAWVAKNGG